MPKPKSGLGKGLGALIGDDALRGSEGGEIALPLSKIEPNAEQPRKLFKQDALEELAESIRVHGIIHPLTVRLQPTGYYQIIDGERRWRAARLAGLDELPVRVFDADDRTAAEMALIQNLQREDLAPLEEASGFRRLIDDYGLTQEEAAARVGKSRPAVANALRLLSLPPSVQALMQDGKLTAGHARALLSLPTKALQDKAAASIVKGGLSVRQAETLAKRLSAAKPDKPRPKTDAHITALQNTLSSQLSRKVKITHSARRGKIELEYYGLDDLDALLAQIGGSK